jgi:mRNA interferase MazF
MARAPKKSKNLKSAESLHAGDVILVKFPFSNLIGQKKRPALVLNVIRRGPESLVTLAMITSQIDGLAIDGDVRILQQEPTGLLHPSIVRLSKVATIDQNLVDQKIGTLSSSDRKLCSAVLRKLFKFWID